MLGLLVTIGTRGQDRAPFIAGQALGKIKHPAIHEASGLIAASENPGFFWTHNDSGDAARIFLVNDSAQLRATYYLSGVTARDWEDIGRMTRAGRNYLLIGDIGDNGARYPAIYLHVVEEPEVRHIDLLHKKPLVDTLPATCIRTFVLTFEKGPRDAESLFFDPIDRYLYIISKRELHAGIYRATLPEIAANERLPADTVVLKQVGAIPYTFITSADIRADGTEILVKNLLNVYYWHRKPGETVTEALSRRAIHLPYTPEPQGEAIAFSNKGNGYYTLSEAVLGLDAILYFYPRQKSIIETQTQ